MTSKKGPTSDKRWDWLEGLQPQTPTQWAVSQMARILLDELSNWPPEVEWTDARIEQRYAALFAADAPLPSNAALDHAIKRTVWELAHADEALEHYRRNNLLYKACPAAIDRIASEFAESYLTEALLELIERTENRVKRRHAIACLEQLSELLRCSRN